MRDLLSHAYRARDDSMLAVAAQEKRILATIRNGLVPTKLACDRLIELDSAVKDRQLDLAAEIERQVS